MIPRADVYTAASGQAIYAGCMAPQPAWVRALPLWRWHEIPNTALSSVDPSPRPLGSTGARSKIEAYCGATLKRSGSIYILGAAGGHANYAGNEVDALRLNTAVPGWVQLRGPTYFPNVVTIAQRYLDKRPAATHTYGMTQFIESLNRMIVMCTPGPSADIGGGDDGPIQVPPPEWAALYGGDKIPATFSLDLNDWDDPDFIPPYVGPGTFTAPLCVRDPRNDDIYYSREYTGGVPWRRCFSRHGAQSHYGDGKLRRHGATGSFRARWDRSLRYLFGPRRRRTNGRRLPRNDV